MISEELLAECQELLNDIAPELAGDCYLINAELLEGVPHVAGNLATAFTRETFIFEVRERLQAAGIWEGARPTIAISADAVVEESGYGQSYRSRVLALLIHEVAHLVPFEPALIPEEMIDDHDTDEARQFQRDRAEVASVLVATADPDSDVYNVHGKHFVRRATHLSARARLMGWVIPSQELWAGVPHMFSPAQFLETLLPEIVEFRDSTFKEIQQQDPPPEFLELWQANCENIRFWNADPRERKRMREAWENEQCNK